MTHAYILTEEGREYNDKGHQFIEDMLRKNHNVKDEILFTEGAEYNKAYRLKKELQNNDNCFVIVSTGTNIFCLYDENIQAFCNALAANPTVSSWKTAVNICTMSE